MNKWNGLLILLVLTGLFAACQKSANNSPYPQISFKYLIPDSVKAGLFSDTTFLAFDYSDGDGDLGSPTKQGQTPPPPTNIYLIDSRDSAKYTYSFPVIEDEAAHDPQNGMSGTCQIILQAATLIPRPDTLHTQNGDTLQYTVYIVDEAGHESNRFTTNKLYIRPR
jgi:hypothetical protein